MSAVFGWIGQGASNAATDYLAASLQSLMQNLHVLSPQQYQTLAQIRDEYLAGGEHLAQHIQPLNLDPEVSQRLIEILQIPRADGTNAELTRIVREQEGNVGARGVAKKAGKIFISTITEQARENLGAWYDQFRSVEPRLDVFRELLAQMQPPQAPQQRPTLQRLQQEVQQQTDLLAENSTSMAMIKTILGRVCGITNLSPQIVATYIEASQASSLRSVVFEAIDDADNVNGLRKLFAKLCYFLLSPLISFYTKHFVHNFANYCQNQLAEFNNGRFEPTLNQWTNFLNDHLASVSGAYRHAADQLPTQRTDAAINTYLMQPEFNGGMTTEELYARMAEAIVQRFAPMTAIKDSIFSLLSSRISEESMFSFLNYPIGFAATIVSAILYYPLAAIDWIVNGISQFLLTRIVKSSELVPSLAQSAREAIGVGKEYKHAMNEFFVRQLRGIWETMNRGDANAHSIEELTNLVNGMSAQTKESLKTLVSTLFLDVGYMVNSDNPAHLAAQVDASRRQVVSEPVKALLDSLGIPIDICAEAQAKTVEYLVLLLHTILQPEMLQEFALTSLNAFNRSFTNQQPPTEQQMNAMERERNQLTNQIVTTAIRRAVNDRFYPIPRMQREADGFVAQVKTDVQQFQTEIAGALQNGQVAELTAIYTRFLQDRNEKLRIEGSREENVNNHLLHQFEQLSSGLIEKLPTILQHIQALQGHDDADLRLAHQKIEKLKLVTRLVHNLTADDRQNAANAIEQALVGTQELLGEPLSQKLTEIRDLLRGDTLDITQALATLKQESAAITDDLVTGDMILLCNLMAEMQRLGTWEQAIAPIQAQNALPIDLSVFSDTVQAFVLRTLRAYTDQIPAFFEKSYNSEAIMRRGMAQFIRV